MAYKKPRRASIKDVAKASGVAPSTVSNVLNGSRYVTPETKQRVLESVERLGYRASAVARGLRMQRSWSVGLLLTSISNPFYPEVARGIEDVVADNECNLILCNTDYQEDKQDRYLNLLIARQVDGIILASHPGPRHFEALEASQVPYVMLNRGLGRQRGDSISMDNRDGIGQAVDHLIALGHRRIAFIRGHPMSGITAERQRYFEQRLRKHGLDVDRKAIVQGRYDYESGREAGEALLALSKRPTAIVSASDLMALGAIDALRGAGLEVPGDVSVVGFDDVFVSGLPMVQLTTVGVDKRELGAAAARLLLERMAGRHDDAARRIVLPTRLVERATTAKPRRVPGRGKTRV